jgi:hypothetical protein
MPQNRLAPPLQNSLAYSVPAPLEPGMLRPAPRVVPRRELENFSIGLGRGLTTGLEGTKQLLTQPVATARALVEAARQMGTDPGIVLEMLRAARQKAMSGSLGLGELIGENLTPGVRNRAPMMAINKFPRVDEIERFSVGIGSFKPRVIAENKPLFRETSAMNVNDFLQNDRQFDYQGGFVTDDPTLAIGQGLNKGVFVQFRPNSVSGEIHAKPGTGVIGGVEYKADVLAPMAVERVTFKNPKKDFKNLAFKSRQNLAQNFTKVQNEDGSITFIRKMED